MENTSEIKTVKIISWIVVGLVSLIITWGSFTIISPGERGIVLRLGSISRTLDQGIHPKFPIIESVKKMDVRIQKEQVLATAASKDLQNVDTTIALNYSLQPAAVADLYSNIGINYKSRIIDPAVQEAVKAATAKYTAEELVTKRPVVQEDIKAILVERLSGNFIVTNEVSVVNFKFSDSFEQAIEAKVTAEQSALAAKNKLEQIKFEAEQRVTTAKAEAEAIRIQAQAITQQGGDNYVQLQAITKWDGQLPQQFVPGSAIPFLNLNK